MIDSVRSSLGRLGSWEGFGRLSRVHSTKVVFVVCFGGLGLGVALWRLNLHAKIRTGCLWR